MQRYYQGQLDFFCAIYAVINALTALYGINLTQARALLATILSDVSRHPGLWEATLLNETDFHWLADHMLLACARSPSYPVRVSRPFTCDHEISETALDLANARAYCETPYDYGLRKPQNAPILWQAFTSFLPEMPEQPRAGTAKRVAMLRFHRYIRYVDTPVVSHWSVADYRRDGLLHLRDASKEESALYSLDPAVTVFAPELISETHTVRIEPESVYFIERR
ncbi:MAG: hypothetical protein DELT_00067 [Desulfovibrio sp.]